MKKTKLKNGLTIITHKTSTNSVDIEVLVKTGMLNETDELNGISHFLEHMAFKGTSEKTAKQLAEELEMVGGICNAYTTIDRTVYWVSLLADHWKTGTKFLIDIIQDSTFPRAELEKERKVILQEAVMCQDNVEHVFWDDVLSSVYKDQRLGRKVIGTMANICQFTRQNLLDYVEENYTLDNMIVSACGNIKHSKFVKYIKELTKDNTRTRSNTTEVIESHFNKKLNATITEKFDQTMVALLFDGITAEDELDPVFNVYNAILAGGMSTRLFQEVREKRGLCYTTSTMSIGLKNAGFYGLFAGIEKVNTEKTISVFKKLIKSMTTDITEEDLEKAKNLLLYTLSKSERNNNAIMTENAECLMYDLKFKSFKEKAKEIKKVTIADVKEFAKKFELKNSSIVTVTNKG